jgi:UDP-3-O-[3-hydroxymyristoyl] glucosamine N-acyltransferase
MQITAKTISEFINGVIEGDPDVVVNDVSKIEEGKKGTIAFLGNEKYKNYIYETNASIVIVNKEFVPEKKVACTLIRVENPYEAFAAILQLKENGRNSITGIDKNCFIHETAIYGKDFYLGAFSYIGKNVVIGNNVKIFPQVYIGDNSKVGDNTIIYPGVKIYHECIIGSNCIIHAGTVIGSDGFGFALQNECEYKKIPQIGNVIIKDNVEIGSNCSVDRATMGSTIIGKGVKIDNLVQIAHNVEIGDNTIIVSQVGIAGSTKIGKNCTIAGQVGITGHLKIADNVKIGAQSGVTSNVEKDGDIILGSPAVNIRDAKRTIAVYKNLPQLRNEIIELRRELEKIKKEGGIK